MRRAVPRSSSGAGLSANRTEILVGDGRSDDGTLEKVLGIIKSHPGRQIRLLDNCDQTPGAALNKLIQHARGDIVVRIDGHTAIQVDYVRACVRALEGSDALNVGGYLTAAGDGYVGRAIAMAISSFWGTGGARFRNRALDQPVYADTVPFGAWRRETFARLGPFQGSWKVNEDCEYNARILDAGGKILLHPGIRAIYFSRESVGALARQYFRYGELKCNVMARHPKQVRARQLAPPLLVMLMVTLLSAYLGWGHNVLLLVPPVGYLSMLVVSSVGLALRRGRPDCAFMLPIVLATLHLSYGTGVLVGASQNASAFIAVRLKRLRSLARRDAEPGLRVSCEIPEAPESGTPKHRQA